MGWPLNYFKLFNKGNADNLGAWSSGWSVRLAVSRPGFNLMRGDTTYAFRSSYP